MILYNECGNNINNNNTNNNNNELIKRYAHDVIYNLNFIIKFAPKSTCMIVKVNRKVIFLTNDYITL